jgi:hypothetical protein
MGGSQRNSARRDEAAKRRSGPFFFPDVIVSKGPLAMTHKEELLAAMRAARVDLEAVVGAYEGRLDETLDDGWQVRDAIAHIAVWERVATRKITGAPLPEGEDLASMQPWDMDTFNDAMIDRWRAHPADDVRAEFAAAHLALVAAVAGANDEDCAPGGTAWQAVDDDGAGHYHVRFPIADPMAARWPQESGTELDGS